MDVEHGNALIDAAIGMTRFPWRIGVHGGVAVLSPDGSKLATVVWRGDLERNVNVYSLLVVEIDGARPGVRPAPLLSIDFAGDPEDKAAAPISEVTFAGNNRTVAFLGTFKGEPRQVYAIDLETGEYHRLTDHPSEVRRFALRPDGSLALYAVALTDPDDDRAEMVEHDGLFVMDPELFPERPAFISGHMAVRAERPRETRHYLLARPNGEPKLVFDSRRSRPTSVYGDDASASGEIAPMLTIDDERLLRLISSLTPDPTGRSALLWPYALADEPMHVERYRYYESLDSYHRGMGAAYGLVDLATGAIERFVDAPHPPHFGFERTSGDPVWAPDGQSVVIYTLLPLDGSDDERAHKEPPRWVEVDLATRRLQLLDIPNDWQVESWNATVSALFLRNRQEFAILPRKSDGSWGEFQPLGTAEGFQDYPEAVTNGRIIAGVRAAPQEPPELVFSDPSDGSLTVATDLNPELRQRPWAEAEEIEWSGELVSSRGYLVKPYGYRPGTRYPLAFLFDDGFQGRKSTQFLLDGGQHLSGHPIEALAARGIAVVYTRMISSFRDVDLTPAEGEHVRDQVESAIAHLDELGIIDPTRVGISGFSRAAYHTDLMLIHSAHRFAAATQIDGGTVDYIDRRRPYYDDELTSIRTPLLLEHHGPASYVIAAAMADRLNALGGAAEILYFPKAPHSVVTPRHRLRSLTVHLDWYCFWLNGEVDPHPAKKRQYERWRELRARLEEAEAAKQV